MFLKIKLPVIVYFLLCFFSVFQGCEKEMLDGEKGQHILLNGYYGGNNPLRIAIDTTIFKHQNDIIQPRSNINFSKAFSFNTAKKRFLTLTDTVTKKVVHQVELPSDLVRVNFNFIQIDGKNQDVIPPAADSKSNKLGFFIYDSRIDYPIDIFLYRKESTGKEIKELIAEKVLPGKWIYVDYMASKNFGIENDLRSSFLTFTKSNSPSKWAFEDNEFKSKLPTLGLFLPKLNDTGKVQPYFITPFVSNQLFSRLFFYLEF